MRETTLYIKIGRNNRVTHTKVVLSDVAKVSCERQDILRKIKEIPLYHFKEDDKAHRVVAMSILKVIQEIQQRVPGLLVINEGEADFVIEYRTSCGAHQWQEYLKTMVLCVIIFFGSAFSIMTFNNDVGLYEVFDQFYFQVMGKEATGLNALEIGYCLGLPIGMVVFFNHIGPKKITHDPTPLQVEMRKYEKDVDSTFIENAGRKEHNIDVE